MDDSLRRVVGDLDGDGRAELVFSASDGSTLGVCSYLFWNDLTGDPPYDLTYLKNAWQDAGPGQIVQMSFQQQSAPAGSGGGGPWVFGAADQRWTADLNGDGTAEILMFNPNNLSIGVCSWSTSDSKVETLWSANNSVPAAVAGGPQWGLHGDDIFFPGRFIVTAGGAQQILVYRPSTLDIGVLEFSNNQLGTLWTGGPTLPPAESQSSSWRLSQSDLFFVARNLGGAGEDLVVVANAASAQTGVLQYSSTGLSVLAAQQLFSPEAALLLADVDGDTKDEILIYVSSGSTASLEILRWNSSALALQKMWVGNLSWDLGGAPLRLARARLGIDPSDDLFVYAGAPSSNPSNLGALTWNPSNSSIETLWTGTFEDSGYWVPGSQQVVQSGQIGWEIKSGDQYFFADLDGDGAEEIVTLNFDTGWIGWLKLIDGNLVLQNDASGAVAGWAPALLTSAPPNLFVPFTGIQEDIYSYLSGYAITGSENNNGADLRALYTNANDQDTYSVWIDNLQSAHNPHPDAWPHKTFEDIRIALHAEVNGVAELSSMVAYQGKINTAITGQQQSDFNTVNNTISFAPPPGASVPFWLGSIVDAVIWGLAAVPLGPEGQIALAVLASLYGSALSDSSSSNITFSTPTALWNSIQSQYDAVITNSLNQQKQFLGDRVILPVLWYLLNNGWVLPEDDLSSVLSARAQDADQLYFYQLMIPLTFDRLIWQNAFQQTPFTWVVQFLNNSEYWQTQNLPATGASYEYTNQGNDLYDIYLICAGAQFDSGSNISNPSDIQYPSDGLMGALAVLFMKYQTNIFLQTAGWSLTDYYVNVNKPS